MSRCTRLAVACFSLVAALAASGAERENVSAVQDALKTRGFYFDQPSGQMDEATRAALKRFQVREGLSVTGEADAATVQALQNPAASAPPRDASTPATPADVSATPPEVPARERARSVVQSDRDFLEKVEPTEVAEPVRELRPPAPAPRPSEPPPPRSTSVKREPNPTPAARRDPVSEEAGTAGISEAEARQFVSRYLAAAEGPTPERELSFYGNRVNYFDSGRVERSYIARDQRNYYRRWPSRDFKLISEPEVTPTKADGATVRFRIRYALRQGDNSASGETENIIRLARTADGLKIVSIRERKLRD